MIVVDLDALVSLLDPDGRGGRRHVDDVATAIRRLVVHIDAAEMPQLVGDTIRRGEEQGRWSATRTATVRRGLATLPKALTLPSDTRATSCRLRPVAPLRDELAGWAANLRLSPPQRQLLVAVNEWLRRTDGGNVPVVAAAERAYELIGDEKAFDSWPPRGGAILWRPGRLTFELLRCTHTPTPLTWEPATSAVTVAGPMICVENHATFRTLLRVLRTSSSPRWVAVAWVQGRNTAPLQSLADLPLRITRLDYLGDLDPLGWRSPQPRARSRSTPGCLPVQQTGSGHCSSTSPRAQVARWTRSMHFGWSDGSPSSFASMPARCLSLDVRFPRRRFASTWSPTGSTSSPA